MKKQPQRHKECNSFKFKSFSERLKQIDIRHSTVYRIQHENENNVLDDKETYFRQVYMKWSVLNLTDEYKLYQNKIRDIVTLHQLLFKKDIVFEHLLISLERASTLSLQPLLEFLVALAKDLREYFYQFFERVLHLLIKLLQTQDTDQLEWVFVCLAFLVKHLKPFLKKNLSLVLNLIQPLMSLGQPEYITNFAAECFSYLARDIRDREQLVALVLLFLRNNISATKGCAKLLYEVIRGTNGQLHSCSAELFKVLLGGLAKHDTFDSNQLYDLMEQIILNLLHNSSINSMQVFWDVILDILSRQLNCVSYENVIHNCSVHKLLQLIGKVVEFRKGVFVSSAVDELINQLINCLENVHCEVYTSIVMCSAELVSAILICENINVTQLDASRLCRKLFDVANPTVFEAFIWNIHQYAQFDLLILPEFIHYFGSNVTNQNSWQLMCRIISAKYPPNRNDIDQSHMKPVLLQFTTSRVIESLECEFIEAANNSHYWEYHLDKLHMALFLWPHVHVQNDISVIICDSINVIIRRIITELKMYTNTNKLTSNYHERQMIMLLSSVVKPMLYYKKYDLIDNDLVDIILSYCSNSNLAICSLTLLDYIVVNIDESFITQNLFKSIHSKIACNLSSEFHQIRLLTLHILRRFGRLPNLCKLGFENNIFNICFEIESISSNISTYREQLLLIEKLETDKNLFNSICNTTCAEDVLRYFLGAMHINFNLLWKPLADIVKSYCIVMQSETFWNVFNSQMCSVTSKIRLKSAHVEQYEFRSKIKNQWLFTEFDVLCGSLERPDYTNYRILLWNSLAGTNISEIHNRDLVDIILDFVDTEYRQLYNTDIFCDLTIARKESTLYNSINNNIFKSTLKTLCSMLTVLSHFSNLSQIVRHSEIYPFLLELLSHRNEQVQSKALQCIMAYKNKCLIPYKDQLFSLIDDSKIKAAITSFKFENQSDIKCCVQPEHRSELMTIVIRLLYSKLTSKNSKDCKQSRKTLIMRFLGTCNEIEIYHFLKMAFVVYDTWMESNSEESYIDTLHTLVDQVCINRTLSPKKLHSSLNLIEIIRAEFGGLLSINLQRYLIRRTFVIGAIVDGVLRKADILIVKYLKMFKCLRTESQNIISNFLNNFHDYPWTKLEIDMIFKLFILPQLARLPSEGIHSATPLLKMFTVFSKNPNFFKFFIYTSPYSNETKTPISYIIDLLMEHKTKHVVCSNIMDIILNLLQLVENSSEDITNKCELICPNLGAIKVKNISLGSSILLPHLPNIFIKLEQKIKKKRGLTRKDLCIISLCTPLVNNSETAEQLLSVILPVFLRKTQLSNSCEEEMTQSISTIQNLFERIDNPQHYVLNIAPFFGQITSIQARRHLCELLSSIARRKEDNIEFNTISSIVNELNAWDKRWIQQPDYMRRLAVFNHICQLQLLGKMSLTLGVIDIYHCFYFIRYEKDLSMRNTCNKHMHIFLPYMINEMKQNNNLKDLKYLIDIVLHQIRQTICDNSYVIRSEGIELMGILARQCSDAHIVLQDLNSLTCSTDREIDFFDNITHLQIHRHTRALVRLCTVAQDLERPMNTRTISQFILPLIMKYICCDQYSSNHGLVTAAIDAIGVVAHMLPWHQYESLLKYFLKKMRHNLEYQKQLVRIVMQILDAFHFDLSNADINRNGEMTEIDSQNDNNINKFENNDNLKNQYKKKVFDKHDVIVNGINKNKQKYAMNKYTVLLSHRAAKRLVHIIAKGLIPQLNNTITNISTFDSFHKLNKHNRRSEREEEEILRVPIALAMVKLLCKLPDGMLEQTLPSIMFKVCHFLKSPLKSVRMCARDILKSIMLTVGTQYLDTLLNQMSTILTRGFQIHVLTVTVYAILDALKHQLKPGELNKNLQTILTVCMEDIFGRSSEEKYISKIGKATPEAKPSNKSFLTLYICALNIDKTCLVDIIIPLREQLLKTHNKNIVVKVQECCHRIMIGLVMNRNIEVQTLLTFIYGIISENIPELLKENKAVVQNQIHNIYQSSDLLIIPKETQSMQRSTTLMTGNKNFRANVNVLVEFSLNMLHFLLKRGKLISTEFTEFLNPIIPLLTDAIRSIHIKITTYALKCLTDIWNREIDLPNLFNQVSPIFIRLMEFIHKYATSGLSTSNENYILVKNVFKSMVAILRSNKMYTIHEEHFKTLLIYIEQSISANGQQSIAFTLLRVIVDRKLLVSELHDVMRKIGEIVITSESHTVRKEAKSILINYLMNYPIGNRIDSFLGFFVSNLSYDLSSGRESVIYFIQSILKRFPQEILIKNAGYLFLTLGARLINDDSSFCRTLIAGSLETLIEKLPAYHRAKLFSIILTLLSDEKFSHREMAALLCTRFILIEKNAFEARIGTVLPKLIELLSPFASKATGQFVRAPKMIIDESMLIGNIEHNSIDSVTIQNCDVLLERSLDHLLIQILNTVFVLLDNFFEVIEQQYRDYLDELSFKVQTLLAYEHIWVRFNAARILEKILSKINVNSIRYALKNHDQCNTDIQHLQFLYSNPHEQLKSLCLDLCAQLLPDVTEVDFLNYIIKNLLYVANFICDLPIDGSVASSFNLVWLIRRLRYVVNSEVSKTPHSILLRSAVFHWIECVTKVLPANIICFLAPNLMAPLIREMSEEDRNIKNDLRQTAIHVGNSIKLLIGDEEYNLLQSLLLSKLMAKRADRRKEIKQKLVFDPEHASLRKQGEKHRKRIARKRKLDAWKGRI